MTDQIENAREPARELRAREAEMIEAANACELPSVRGKFVEAAERWRKLAELAEAPSFALSGAGGPTLR